ncbi:MAG: DUF2339 domain-containing protein [Proteobacteria bacterium]|nr:DUF2339 domain-containing protein [Pseudomonadota bacterium]
MEEVLLYGPLLLFAIFGVPTLAIMSFVRTGRLRRDIDALRARLDSLAPAATAPIASATPAPARPELPPEAAGVPLFEPEPVQPAARAPSPAAPAAEPSPPAPPTVEAAAAAAPKASIFSEGATVRWATKLGGLAMALGGVFFVQYSIEAELIGPTARVVLGALFGIALIGGAEWLRQRPLPRGVPIVADLDPTLPPAAMAAAGVSILFASVFAGYALYDLVPQLLAFLLLAGIAAVAVGLSLLHGPYIALLGLVGAFVLPALVPSEQPSAVNLFVYLLLVVAGALAVVRYKAWWWLAWAALAGASIWPLLWFSDAWRSGDTLPIGLYIVLVAGLFVYWLGASLPPAPPPAAEPAAEPGNEEYRPAPITLPAGHAVVWSAAAVSALLMFCLVRMAYYEALSLALLGALCGLYGFVGRRNETFDRLAGIAALAAVATLAAWHVPQLVEQRPLPLGTAGGEPTGFIPGPIVAPELAAFSLASALFAALFGVGGYAALWGAARPGLWAATSAVGSVAVAAVAYWRSADFEVSLLWAAVSLGLAAAALAAATRVAAHRERPGMDDALAVYAIAVIAAATLAMTTVFRLYWLSVALAAQLPALAWVRRKVEVKWMALPAMVIAGAVLARLLLNTRLLDYPIGTTPIFNWLLYGYGLPILAFIFAAREFSRLGEDKWLILLLEAGAIVLSLAFISLEIRHLIGGGTLKHPVYDLLEQSLQSIAWLGVALGLHILHARRGGLALAWGWRIIAGAAAAHVVFFQLVLSNPLFDDAPIGGLPIVNLLFLAYAAPAAFAVVFALRFRRLEWARLATATGIGALALAFFYLSCEVRRAFQGTQIGVERLTSDGEWYAYSVAWLAFGAALLGLGIRMDRQVLRHASLAVIALTVLKVFLSDMSTLTGLYRAASFIGLGACLVALGWLYQRFVFAPRATAAGNGATTST